MRCRRGVRCCGGVRCRLCANCVSRALMAARPLCPGPAALCWTPSPVGQSCPVLVLQSRVTGPAVLQGPCRMRGHHPSCPLEQLHSPSHSSQPCDRSPGGDSSDFIPVSHRRPARGCGERAGAGGALQQTPGPRGTLMPASLAPALEPRLCRGVRAARVRALGGEYVCTRSRLAGMWGGCRLPSEGRAASSGCALESTRRGVGRAVQVV